MIKNFVSAWDRYNNLLLLEFIKNRPSCYKDIVVKLMDIVINSYLIDIDEFVLDIDRMTVIDDGSYQGTTIYVVPFQTYQPCVHDYVFTHNYYGSCSGCDAFEAIYSRYSLWDEDVSDEENEKAAKDFYALALNLLQRFQYLAKEVEE